MNYNIPYAWHINHNDSTPLFKQLADNIQWSIVFGNIGEGLKLPPVRVMAKELEVGVDTVRAAYKLLEKMGLIVSRPHYGSIVISPGNDSKPDTTSFEAAIRDYLGNGAGENSIKKLFNDALKNIIENTESKKLIYIDDEKGCVGIAEQISGFLGIDVDYMVRKDFLDNAQKNPELFDAYKAVVTNSFQYSKVLQVSSSIGLPTYTVVIGFSPETMHQITKLRKKAVVGVLCMPNHLKEHLVPEVANIRSDLQILSASWQDKNGVKKVLEKSEMLLVTTPIDEYLKDIDSKIPMGLICDTVNAQSLSILRIQTRI